MGERKRKRERGKEKIFPVFRLSELDSLRTKVGPRNESYAWVPKFEFFVKTPRGMGFLLHWFLLLKGRKWPYGSFRTLGLFLDSSGLGCESR